MADRRIRKARFSSRDLCVLVDAVMERREEIFGRGGDPPDTQRRRDAWRYVTGRVNAVSGTRRTWEEVRKKVHDLKKSTKEKLAYNRRSWQAAGGGGPPDVKTLTEFENDMIVVFGKESLEGLRPVDIGTMPRPISQREHCGQHVVSEEQHAPEYQLSSIPLDNTDMPLIRGIKDENQETPSESLSTSEEWEEVVVGAEGTTVEAWRPSMVGALTQLDAVTDLNGPAFKRRLLEHGVRVEQSLAFMHTTLEDGMVRLDQRLSSLQSAIEQIATPVTAAVETSLMQAIGTAGASLMNAHSVAMDALGSKLKEAVVAGFDSLGEQLHGTMTEGFKNLIAAQYSTLAQMIAYCEEMPSTSGLNEVQAVDIHVSTNSVPPHISAQVSGGGNNLTKTERMPYYDSLT
ncbi:uncharacterized protein LOC119953436 isoform X2 [Scyliorhinus canicula]|uniref:uncharacterized protein LOC119953436 isoform X2 n=1 Tax=Scyliorhinus canicula TaxID=7830 RepID=UPI0018F5B354|nr:uncharacterized protein LOC119953436 isoform X2 [Scyliorhinus canicula]